MSTETRVGELLYRWNLLREQGRTLTPAELCTDCPDVLPKVERLLGFLKSADEDESAPATLADWGSAVADSPGELRADDTLHRGNLDTRLVPWAEAPGAWAEARLLELYLSCGRSLLRLGLPKDAEKFLVAGLFFGYRRCEPRSVSRCQHLLRQLQPNPPHSGTMPNFHQNDALRELAENTLEEYPLHWMELHRKRLDDREDQLRE